MALFKDTDDFKVHAPDISRNYDWERELKQKVEQITRLRIIPFISQEEYNLIETAYLGSTLSAAQTVLLTYLQPAIAYYTYLHLLTTGRVNVSAMGIQESRSDDGTSNPASFHAIADVKEEVAEMAYAFFDMALDFMELNSADFALWTASEAYTELKKCFVWNTDIFNQHVRAGSSRHTFLSVRPEIIFFQENHLKNEIGDTLYNTLISTFKDNTLSAENAKLIPLIQAWIAPAAMSRAIPLHRVRIEGGQVMIRSKMDGPNAKSPAGNDSTRHLIEVLTSQSEMAKSRLISFLEENATDYPDYPNQNHQLDDGETSYRLPNNANKRSFRV